MEPSALVTTITLVGSAESDGALALLDQHLPPFSPRCLITRARSGPLGCYVLDGAVAFTRDADTVMLRPGEVLLLRPHQSLVYWNPCAAPARLLLIVTPASDGALLPAHLGGADTDGAAPWDTS